MADPNAPIEATYYRCLAYGGVIGGGGYVYMNENEIVREVVRTSPEYVAAVANGWLYVFRMLTDQHGWCRQDDVRSVFSVIGGVTVNRPFLNPPRWHLTFAQNRQCLMVQLVLHLSLIHI